VTSGQDSTKECTGDMERSAPCVYDLAIIGAGISGLNALYVAQQYLPEGARVALIDCNAECGGMWTNAYDYVRLHQPHAMFTVGDLAWRWRRPPGYLADRDEVCAHLRYCRDTSRAGIDLTEFYECRATKWWEEVTCDGPVAHVEIHDAKTDAPVSRISARHLIDSIGMDIPRPEPLTVSTDAVLSTTPDHLRADIAANPGRSVYVVGGGKTAMDTVLEVLSRDPEARVSLIEGKGTVFALRDKFFPTGVAKGWRGAMVLPMFRRIAMEFDGENEEACYEKFRAKYSVSPGPAGQQYFFGILSESEAARVRDGLQSRIADYFEDVIDTPDGPVMTFRSGDSLAIEPGAIIVNCTGLVLRQDQPAKRLLSELETILTISTRCAVHFQTHVSAYFLTHLLYLGKLRSAPLLVLDVDDLLSKGRKLWQMTVIAHAFRNSVALLDILPFKVMDRCGLDLDRWHALPRRAIEMLRVRANGKRYIAHCDKVIAHVTQTPSLATGGMG